jgi:two-component system, LytTR family, response regulator
MRMLRLLIADDEPLIRRGIRNAVEAIDGIDVVGEASNGEEAIAAIQSLAPDLALLDVQMPGCSGMEVVRRIGPDRMPAVIFVTAYDDYAVQAFEVNAVDYVLKPFDAERVEEAIDRARDRLSSQTHEQLAEQLRALLTGREQRRVERLVVRNGERFEMVPLDTIDWIEAADNYVQLHCGPKRHLLGETLTSLAQRLDPERFVRVHRSRMVNASRIVAVHVLMGGAYELELRCGTRLTTGRNYRAIVQQMIRG